MTHEDYMQKALELARLGRGRVNPNPMVGAVIMKNGRIIGEGYHRRYGELHAERNALAACTEDPRGATMYVTLEPCCHHGKTPPCTEAILERGITHVVVGSGDPNPLVAGRGIATLREHGVTVTEGVLRDQCDALNRVFFHYIREKTPYVVMKYAMTADGKIATVTGASKWITGEAAREQVHRTRNDLSAIMVGVGTVLTDDPLLTCRLPEGRNPVRIICDSRLRTPEDANIARTAQQVPTYIAYASGEGDGVKRLEDRGCKLLHLPGPGGKVDLPRLMETLHGLQLDSVLVEGGATLNYSLLEAGLVSRLQVYIAPKLFGGQAATGPVGGGGVALPEGAFPLSAPTVTPVGDDLLLEYDVLREVG